MSKRDHAIIVGIRRYPRFGRTIFDGDDLQGPDNDAMAVYSWLADPKKGAVPKKQIHYVRSADFADPFADPAQAQPGVQDVLRAFGALEIIAQKNLQDGKGLQVGRRLYVYVAGHGFSPGSKQGAVFTADATRELTMNVDVTSWVEGLYDRKYFEEFVLWMDSCMSFQLNVVPGIAPYAKKLATGSLPKLVTIFAARKPQETLEKKMPDERVHGVFTWTLLQGLNGGAKVDEANQITTSRLKNYMIEGMRTLLSDEEKADDLVSQEPDFGTTDEIAFATIAPRRFKVVLKFSAPAAAKPVVVLGDGLKKIRSAKIAGPSLTLKLTAGMYAAVSDGQSTTFQVVGDRDVEVG